MTKTELNKKLETLRNQKSGDAYLMAIAIQILLALIILFEGNPGKKKTKLNASEAKAAAEAVKLASTGTKPKRTAQKSNKAPVKKAAVKKPTAIKPAKKATTGTGKKAKKPKSTAAKKPVIATAAKPKKSAVKKASPKKKAATKKPAKKQATRKTGKKAAVKAAN